MKMDKEERKQKFAEKISNLENRVGTTCVSNKQIILENIDNLKQFQNELKLRNYEIKPLMTDLILRMKRLSPTEILYLSNVFPGVIDRDDLQKSVDKAYKQFLQVGEFEKAELLTNIYKMDTAPLQKEAFLNIKEEYVKKYDGRHFDHILKNTLFEAPKRLNLEFSLIMSTFSDVQMHAMVDADIDLIKEIEQQQDMGRGRTYGNFIEGISRIKDESGAAKIVYEFQIPQEFVDKALKSRFKEYRYVKGYNGLIYGWYNEAKTWSEKLSSKEIIRDEIINFIDTCILDGEVVKERAWGQNFQSGERLSVLEKAKNDYRISESEIYKLVVNKCNTYLEQSKPEKAKDILRMFTPLKEICDVYKVNENIDAMLKVEK
jgi:hypothetical protein